MFTGGAGILTHGHVFFHGSNGLDRQLIPGLDDPPLERVQQEIDVQAPALGAVGHTEGIQQSDGSELSTRIQESRESS